MVSGPLRILQQPGSEHILKKNKSPQLQKVPLIRPKLTTQVYPSYQTITFPKALNKE